MTHAKTIFHSKNAELTVADLRGTLGALEKLFDAAGARVAAKDLQVLSKVFEPFEYKTVQAFCDAAAGALSLLTDKSRERQKMSKSAGRVAIRNDDAIVHHVAQLRQSGTDRAAFDVSFENLKADKSLKAADVAEIARQYSLSITKYKSIGAAQTDIEKAFIRQARFENKLR